MLALVTSPSARSNALYDRCATEPTVQKETEEPTNVLVRRVVPLTRAADQ
jgi:hypothetical protein